MTNLSHLLACPRCRAALDGWSCPSCQVTFPVLDGVPWLVSDPDAVRFQWRNRWQLGLADLERRQRAVREAAGSATDEATLARLGNLAEGYAAQHRGLKTLLGSLGLAAPADLETYLALRTRLPTQVGLTSYQANVFRDWCWGDAENRASVEAISGSLAPPGAREEQSLLVLGAGAGRLAFDLHQDLEIGLTVALEFNPYLTILARRLAAGEAIDLVEFPIAPAHGARSAIARTLAAPAPAREGFEVVLADAMNPPFLPGAFDLVATPWLVDVIDAPPRSLLQQVNTLLKPGGEWIYHGSLAFDRPDPAENLNLEELTALAVECGFRVGGTEEREMPYLNCPDSRHGRRERVVTFVARKATALDPPPPHQSLPDWIARGDEPVPLLASFQSQAMAVRIHAFIMSLIDGRRSLEDMAAVLEEQQLMGKEEARVAIRGFLIKMYDEASTGRGFS